MQKKKIKELILKYEDGTEEVVKQGMLATSRTLGNGQAEMRLRNLGMDYDTTQNYYVGLLHSISRLMDSELLDKLEEETENL